MYLFNEMHTNMEHIAVPHPPQFANWGTFPPGEGIALWHPYKHQFIGQRGKTDMHILFSPEACCSGYAWDWDRGKAAIRRK